MRTRFPPPKPQRRIIWQTSFQQLDLGAALGQLYRPPQHGVAVSCCPGPSKLPPGPLPAVGDGKRGKHAQPIGPLQVAQAAVSRIAGVADRFATNAAAGPIDYPAHTPSLGRPRAPLPLPPRPGLDRLRLAPQPSLHRSAPRPYSIKQPEISHERVLISLQSPHGRVVHRVG